MSILDDIGSVFTAPVEVIKDVVSFLQWISWLFHPLNWLRMVEFVIGSAMFGIGLYLVVKGSNAHPGRDLKQIVTRQVRGGRPGRPARPIRVKDEEEAVEGGAEAA